MNNICLIRLLSVVVTGIFALSLSAQVSKSNLQQNSNLILITIDGARWQDVLGRPDPWIHRLDGKQIMPHLQNELIAKGVFIGNRKMGSHMEVGNPIAISLPGYYSIFSGLKTNCGHNLCGRITLPTVFERLIEELGLPKKEIATFASWHNILWAIESHEGMTEANGPMDINEERWDQDTLEAGIEYWKKNHPRLLYLALNDPDRFAHEGDYRGYVNALRKIDRLLKELVDDLSSEGEFAANTTLIVTTDHGRGLSKMWREHHKMVYGSDQIWLYAYGPLTPATGFLKDAKTYGHLDIRPTLEAFFGLAPVLQDDRGTVIKELFFAK